MTASKIRVLQTIRQGKIGGGESHVLDLVQSLDRAAFEPVVLSFTDGPMLQSLARMEVPAHVIHTEKAFDFRVWKAVKQFLQEQQIQLVHVHGTRANTNVLWAARNLGLPVIYTVHGWSFHDGLQPLMKKARILAEKFITRRTDMNVTVSESNKQTGIRAFGNFRATVIHNGVNLERFNRNGTYADVKAAYGIPAHHLVVGYIVRMTHQKDPLNMIRAFATVAAANPDITLIMVGEGELRGEAEALARSLAIKNRVIFDNFRQDVPAVLNAVDIYCLPSLWEGFPIGVLEAMAMGKAAIASDVDGTREAITHGENGLLVPAKEPHKLAEAILQVAADHALRTRLQQAAVNCIHEHYQVAGMTRKIEALYQQVMASHHLKN